MAKVMIVDDNEILCEALSQVVKDLGHGAKIAHTLSNALESAAQSEFDAIFLDVRMPDGDGLDIVSRLKASPSSPEVIIMTGFGDSDGAELAIRCGAWDYIQKPSSIKAMKLPLLRALQYRDEKFRNRPKGLLKRCGIVGNSSAINLCLDLVGRAATGDFSVLVNGETGTGKELFARAIHRNSPRAHKNFVVVDCAALPETLVEGILFGHKKGAFTGALREQGGLIKQADGGTLFLDEVGELSLRIQKSFLRVLQEYRFRPLGGGEEIASNFRVIAATNRDLEHMVQKGLFRQDLLFRLQSFVIRLPPLRDRREDIVDLVMSRTAKTGGCGATETKGFSPEFFEALNGYDWPGNVRELFNALNWASAAAGNEGTLFCRHLPDGIRIKAAQASLSVQSGNSAAEPDPGFGFMPEDLPSMHDFRDMTEKHYLKTLMGITAGDMKKSCRISRLSRSRLYQLFKKHGLNHHCATMG